MKVPAPNQTSFKPAPEGIHPAIIYQVVDLGTQKTDFQGETGQKHQVRFTLELLSDDCKLEDGRPMSIGVTRTVSLHENSRLRKDLEAIRGKAYTPDELNNVDLIRLAGTSCNVFVAHIPKGDGVISRIDRFMKWNNSAEKPVGVNEVTTFDFEEPSMKSLDALPEWIQEIVRKSPEYAFWVNSDDAPYLEDEIPF